MNSLFVPPQQDRYKGINLQIVQQPVHARVCGFSIPDRRPIQPPPVIKVSGVNISERSPLVMFASLWSRDLQQNLSYSHKAMAPFAYKNATTPAQGRYDVLITEGYVQSLLLIGTLVSELNVLQDVQRVEGLYFVYPDLGVRSSGYYRLKFELFELGAQGSKVLATCVSDIFQVCCLLPRFFDSNSEGIRRLAQKHFQAIQMPPP
ncbi:velvet factor-domain-containing protein [Chytriomyces sp. MP71]|nr:velvet factor-domain-containing protein [Chytriomyces sp. MP71]